MKFALDAILSPRCLTCDVETSGTGALCLDWWSTVDFLAASHCECCGLPFEVAVGSLRGTCTRERPSYIRARTVFRYGEVSRSLILRFKHGDRTDAAPAFGSWLARAGQDLLTLLRQCHFTDSVCSRDASTNRARIWSPSCGRFSRADA